MNQKQLYFTASHCMLFSLRVCACRSVGSSSLINQARSASPWTPTSSATPVTWAGCAPLTAFPHTTHTESGRDWCSVGPTYTALWLCMHICDPRLFVTVFLKYLLFPCVFFPHHHLHTHAADCNTEKRWCDAIDWFLKFEVLHFKCGTRWRRVSL